MSAPTTHSNDSINHGDLPIDAATLHRPTDPVRVAKDSDLETFRSMDDLPVEMVMEIYRHLVHAYEEDSAGVEKLVIDSTAQTHAWATFICLGGRPRELALSCTPSKLTLETKPQYDIASGALNILGEKNLTLYTKTFDPISYRSIDQIDIVLVDLEGAESLERLASGCSTFNTSRTGQKINISLTDQCIKSLGDPGKSYSEAFYRRQQRGHELLEPRSTDLDTRELPDAYRRVADALNHARIHRVGHTPTIFPNWGALSLGEAMNSISKLTLDERLHEPADLREPTVIRITCQKGIIGYSVYGAADRIEMDVMSSRLSDGRTLYDIVRRVPKIPHWVIRERHDSNESPEEAAASHVAFISMETEYASRVREKGYPWHVKSMTFVTLEQPGSQ